MSWISKEIPSNYDAQTINGLSFVDGNILAEQYNQPYVKDKKSPVITFPSGSFRTIHQPEDKPSHIRILDQFQAPLQITQTDLIKHVLRYNMERDADFFEFEIYLKQVNKSKLLLSQLETAGSYQVTIDNKNQIIQDVEYFPQVPGIPESKLAPRPMELFDESSRLALPSMYSTEGQGSDAIAPVKFFSPDAGWTWYATEFDGQDRFFGLVSGQEVELGYFSLSELLQGRGRFGLPIERDLYYLPKTIAEIKSIHKQY